MKTRTYSKLPRPMQTLNLIHAVTDLVEHFVEPGDLDDFLRRLKDDHRVWAHVIVDVDGDDVVLVEVW